MKHTTMKRHMLLLPIFLVAVVALIVVAAVPGVWASGSIQFEEAEIFFELNDTDEDLGIHGMIDGGPWKYVKIKDSRRRLLMYLFTWGKARQQALTELFFESAEPTFDELSPPKFFRRFPEGYYRITGTSQEGDRLYSRTLVTHLMPAPPEPTVNGQPMAPTCDDEDEDYDEELIPTIAAGTDVIISWDPVTQSHSELGRTDEPVNIVNYEVVVEVEWEVGGEEFVSVFSIILPPDQTEVTIPQELITLGLDEAEGEFKYEVLAREESYNQTAVESCFLVE